MSSPQIVRLELVEFIVVRWWMRTEPNSVRINEYHETLEASESRIPL